MKHLLTAFAFLLTFSAFGQQNRFVAAFDQADSAFNEMYKTLIDTRVSPDFKFCVEEEKYIGNEELCLCRYDGFLVSGHAVNISNLTRTIYIVNIESEYDIKEATLVIPDSCAVMATLDKEATHRLKVEPHGDYILVDLPMNGKQQTFYIWSK